MTAFHDEHSTAKGQSGGSHFSIPSHAKLLDSVQLAEMERSFRTWAMDSSRADVRWSRQRILLIFLLIRHTGAKLHEVLELRPRDIDPDGRAVGINKGGVSRTVEMPDDLAHELRAFLAAQDLAPNEALFRVDPGHVRRKFYERAEACGLPRDYGNPSALRRSRSVELLRGNLPLPVVQKLLGHSTPNLTAALLDVSAEDMHHAVRQHLDRESKRRTSARNAFFGKIIDIIKGDIQSEVILHTLGGLRVTSVITNTSLHRVSGRGREQRGKPAAGHGGGGASGQSERGSLGAFVRGHGDLRGDHRGRVATSGLEGERSRLDLVRGLFRDSESGVGNGRGAIMLLRHA